MFVFDCQVDPPIGVTMTTAFTLRATGWFDPLSDSLLGNEDDEIAGFVYKFGYYKKLGAKLKFTLLVPFSQSSEISGILLPPPGSLFMKFLSSIKKTSFFEIL